MSELTLQQFTDAMLARGYQEVLVREWAPGHETPEHTHPFDVDARVVQGEFWLTVDGRTRHLRANDSFQLQRDVPHAERYGPLGAIFWAARRNPV